MAIREVYVTLGKRTKIVLPIPTIIFEVHTDLDDPKNLDDEYILYNETTEEIVEKVAASSLSEIREDVVELKFQNLNENHKYSLAHDPKNELGEIDYIFNNFLPEEIENFTYDEE